MKIEEVEINDFNGIMNYRITFNKNLNIISGENGTGKTRLLQAIKEGRFSKIYENEQFLHNRIFAINPKRNSQRQEIISIAQNMRQSNRTFQNLTDEAIGKHFNNAGFDNYSSFGELFVYYFDKLDRAGGDRQTAMQNVAQEFNQVLNELFKNYKINAKWNSQNGVPEVSLFKNNSELPMSGLSCGENEIFSLILNLHTLKDSFDVFLIDEPETHLNWHLEKKLFEYLESFATQNDKQIIVATHSRIISDKNFTKYVQYLLWDKSQIRVDKKIPEELKNRLAQEAIENIKLNSSNKLIIFCEDFSHKIYFTKLVKHLGIIDFEIVECGCKENVRNLYRLNKRDNSLNKSLFFEDGDNEGPWKESGDFHFKLSVYCIENTIINITILKLLTNMSEKAIKQMLLSIIKKLKDKIIGKNKFLNPVISLLKHTHITQDFLNQLDGSLILEDLVKELNFKNMEEILNAIYSDEKISKKFIDIKIKNLILSMG